MRVALITDGIWPYVLGGMQKHSYYLCKYLAQNKVEVHLYHFNQSTYDVSQLEFFTDSEKKYIVSHIINFPSSFNFPGAYVYQSYAYSKLIFDAIKTSLSQYDFIYTKGFTGWYLLKQKHKGAVTCAKVGVKLHGYEMFQKPPSVKAWLQQVLLLRAPAKKISQMADVVFSYGGGITTLIEHLGVKKEKIFELPSGVEASFMAQLVKPTQEKIKFLFLGRYERRKGIEELNKAIELLTVSESEKCEFHFIGPIPPHKRINHQAVTYHGEVRDKQTLQTLIKQNDVLLCPSWSEGFPNSILEAMALGLTVVATNIGAVSVLVNQTNGWLINKSEPILIHSAIQEIIFTDVNSITAKKQQALTHIKQNFTWEILINSLIMGITRG